MLDTIIQLFKFMKVYRKFWLAPIILGLLLLGSIMIAAESTAIAPFIYAIF
jgi:hypothetical protein